MTRVIVVGGGNAALCAAIAAREAGAEVALLERAPHALRGGNSRFTAGAMRVVYDGVDDLMTLMPDLSREERERSDFGIYTREQFFDDMANVTRYRCDPDLAEQLVNESLPTLQWMQRRGVRFLPLYHKQAFKVDGKFRFWGGLTIQAWGGGPGLVDSLTEAARRASVEIRYGARVTALLTDGDSVNGVVVRCAGEEEQIKADAVVLACGGFESNTEWRTRYLGPGWDLARVRGTRFNTGDGIRIAIDVGAASRGHWSGCHAVGWDMNAPAYGDLDVGDGFQKHSYPFGILVNADGERFVDEGADFRNLTYAKYGAEVLRQPGQFAWQIFDAKVSDLLRDEYRIRQITKAEASSLEELALRLDGVDAEGFLTTVKDFNQAVDTSVPFDPTILDGRGTTGLQVPKSNWANPLDTPPFQAFGITCGITFTFGGLHVTPDSRVLSEEGDPIPGLFAAGELMGGLFYFNYPGGTGLTSGAVFGRTAGLGAAKA